MAEKGVAESLGNLIQGKFSFNLFHVLSQVKSMIGALLTCKPIPEMG